MDERRLFGQIAVKLGFIDAAVLHRALDVQIEERRAGKGHKLLGVILVEGGFMTAGQVFEVLQAFDVEETERGQPGAGVRSVVIGSDQGPVTDTVSLLDRTSGTATAPAGVPADTWPMEKGAAPATPLPGTGPVRRGANGAQGPQGGETWEVDLRGEPQ